MIHKFLKKGRLWLEMGESNIYIANHFAIRDFEFGSTKLTCQMLTDLHNTKLYPLVFSPLFYYVAPKI